VAQRRYWARAAVGRKLRERMKRLPMAADGARMTLADVPLELFRPPVVEAGLTYGRFVRRLGVPERVLRTTSGRRTSGRRGERDVELLEQ
jgi:hypothetical protein